MAIVLQRGERDPQKIVDSIIQLTQGRQNSIVAVTLRASHTTTVVPFVNCSTACAPLPVALTAHAAAELAAGTMYVSSIGQGTFTVTHASNSQTDRNFLFACLGG